MQVRVVRPKVLRVRFAPPDLVQTAICLPVGLRDHFADRDGLRCGLKLALQHERQQLVQLEVALKEEARGESRWREGVDIEAAVTNAGGMVNPKLEAFQVHITQMRPKSRGTVRLHSGDPRQAPRIQFNHLQEIADVRDIRDALRLTHQLQGDK